MKQIILYHGSTQIIEKPKLRLRKIHNDYGQGFYCTEDYELACEWAVKNNTNLIRQFETHPVFKQN